MGVGAELAFAAVAGTSTFPICLGLAQILVFKPLRIHARVPVIASAAGFMSVAFASAMAAKSFKAARNNYTAASEIFSKGSFSSADKDRASKWLNEQLAVSGVPETIKSWGIKAFEALGSPIALQNFDWYRVADRWAREHREALAYAIGGVGVFVLLGGRFRSVLPSSLYHPGAFARTAASIEARGSQYITASEREGNARLGVAGLNDFGRRLGCHTCGRRNVDVFIGDHMPPNKYAHQFSTQRLYPQCPTCSQLQSVAVRTDRPKYVTHGGSLRPYHLWLPLPPVVEYLLSLS